MHFAHCFRLNIGRWALASCKNGDKIWCLWPKCRARLHSSPRQRANYYFGSKLKRDMHYLSWALWNVPVSCSRYMLVSIPLGRNWKFCFCFAVAPSDVAAKSEKARWSSPGIQCYPSKNAQKDACGPIPLSHVPDMWLWNSVWSKLIFLFLLCRYVLGSGYTTRP